MSNTISSSTTQTDAIIVTLFAPFSPRIQTEGFECDKSDRTVHHLPQPAGGQLQQMEDFQRHTYISGLLWVCQKQTEEETTNHKVYIRRRDRNVFRGLIHHPSGMKAVLTSLVYQSHNTLENIHLRLRRCKTRSSRLLAPSALNRSEEDTKMAFP